jgi:hypothetical protein
MKTRNGFVSNSSSSSFMLASNKDADDIEMTLTLKTKLNNLLEMTIKTKEDLLDYYKELGFETEADIIREEFMLDDYKACLKAIKAGKKVHVVSISSDGTPLEAALYDSGEGKIPESNDYEVISK